MIAACLNPRCRAPLHYLRAGRIVRTLFLEGASLRVEHFWLCGECSRTYDFCLLPNEPATVIRCESPMYGQRFVGATKGLDVARPVQKKESAILPASETRITDFASNSEELPHTNHLGGYVLRFTEELEAALVLQGKDD